MKKTIALFLAMMLVFITTVAYAAEPITLDVVALDYQTCKPVTKTYVENERFCLRVDIGIPRFADIANLELKIELDGVELDADTVITLTDGSQYIEGIVVTQPAALRVIIKDTAYDNAQTAEELYNAQQHDRTITKTYYFYNTTNASSTYQPTVVIPKTGDISAMPGIVACVAAAIIFIVVKRRTV